MHPTDTMTSDGANPSSNVPELCDGTELLGPYEGSGFTTPQFLLRRRDGQVMRVSQLLYLITAQIDGHHDLATIAERVTKQLDRELTAENVARVIDTKLDMLGIIAGRSDSVQVATDPLLGLRLRAGLVPERLHRGATSALRPLFAPPVVVAVLVALGAFDAWLIGRRRSVLLDGWIEILTRPGLFLAFIGVTLLAMAFHEFGHATACRYSGGRPGAMGVGVYIVWPAFFTDVSDAYRLNRRGRLRTDLGGIYFNALVALSSLVAFTATGFAPLAVLSALTQIQALYQLVPFVRLDGYYILADLIGVPNPFTYVRATFTAAFASRASDARRRSRAMLRILNRKARTTLIAWVLLTVPLLLAGIALSIYLLPRTAPVLWSTIKIDARAAANGASRGRWIDAVNGGVQLIFLTLPLLGWLSSLWYLARLPATRRGLRAIGNPRRWPRAVVVAVIAVACAGIIGLSLSTLSRTSSQPPVAKPAAVATDDLIERTPTPVITEPSPPAPPTYSVPTTAGTNAPAPDVPANTANATAPAVAPVPTPASGRWTLLQSADEITRLPMTAPTAIGVWHVERGDDFWKMAGQVLTDALGRAPTPAEHGTYWSQLVEANRDRLVHADDASTIFAGQDFIVILPQLPGQPALFGAPPP